MKPSADLPHCEECRAVVLRVYGELLERGASEEEALRASYRVLSLRHPKRDRADIVGAVSAWIANRNGVTSVASTE